MSATNRGAIRNENDFYATPPDAVEAIFARISCDAEAIAFEPCRGSGSITNKFTCNTVYYCELSEGIDFLADRPLPLVDLTVTNPPFSLAQEFITKSLQHTRGIVAYLLRLNFLGSQKRKDWWQSRRPSHLYILSKRPSFTGGATDATEYAWFIWDLGGSSAVRMKDPAGVYIL